MRRLMWAKWVFVTLMTVFLVAPTLIVLVVSFEASDILYFPPPGFDLRWYRNFFTDPTWIGGLVTSLNVAVGATIVATVLGTLTALGLVRGTFPGRGLVTGLMLSPLIAPTVIVGLGMYIMYLDLHMTGTMVALIASHAALVMPLVVVNVAASLRTVDRNIELAARNLGAGPIETFVRITLPMILPGALTGAVFAFIVSFDEVVIALFLSSPLQQTLPVVMWSGVQFGVDPTVSAASSVVTGVGLVMLFFFALLRRGSGVGR